MLCRPFRFCAFSSYRIPECSADDCTEMRPLYFCRGWPSPATLFLLFVVFRSSAVSGQTHSRNLSLELTANLAPSLELMTDVVEHPAFADNDIERIRSQLLTAIAQARTSRR